jgi:hypothetical protein
MEPGAALACGAAGGAGAAVRETGHRCRLKKPQAEQ